MLSRVLPASSNSTKIKHAKTLGFWRALPQSLRVPKAREPKVLRNRDTLTLFKYCISRALRVSPASQNSTTTTHRNTFALARLPLKLGGCWFCQRRRREPKVLTNHNILWCKYAPVTCYHAFHRQIEALPKPRTPKPPVFARFT